ncbi:MAG: hypothetical protein ACLPPV_00990 [Candidatus Korobacteraceae bacterium]|jgi:hypothetical protein
MPKRQSEFVRNFQPAGVIKYVAGSDGNQKQPAGQDVMVQDADGKRD